LKQRIGRLYGLELWLVDPNPNVDTITEKKKSAFECAKYELWHIDKLVVEKR
jgi:hypothetical protein